MSHDDAFDWTEFRRLTAENRRRPRVRYQVKTKASTSKSRWTRPRADHVDAAAIKNAIKAAIIADPKITARELAQQFEGISPLTLAMIRSEFLADLRLLRRLGKIVSL